MKSNGILFFTDFHAHLFMEFAKHDDTYYTDRFKTQIELLNSILDKAEKDSLAVVFGGDLFHKRGAVDVRVFNAVWEAFANHSGIPDIHLVRGNHDSYDNSMGSVSSLDTFTNLGKHVHVWSRPGTYRQEVGDTVYDLSFMPYGEDIVQMKDELQELANDAKARGTKNILIAHLGVDGAKQGQSSHRLASAFTMDDMHADTFDDVYLGHYHNRQHLADNVWYGGSTMQLSFNDEGQDKGYDILHADGSWDFIPSNTPKFVTVTSAEQLKKVSDTDYVRVRLPESQAKKLPAMLSPVEMANVRVEAQIEQNTESRLDINADDNPQAVVTKFMDEYYPDTKQLALDVLKEAIDG